MTPDEVKARVVSTIDAHVPKPDRKNGVWKQKTLPDLQVDSLAMAEIVFDLEEAFGVDIEWQAIDAGLMKLQAMDACEALAGYIHPLVLARLAKPA